MLQLKMMGEGGLKKKSLVGFYATFTLYDALCTPNTITRFATNVGGGPIAALCTVLMYWTAFEMIITPYRFLS